MQKFLLILCLYLPFQLALNPTVGIDLASIRVFIIILFFAWLAEGLRRKNFNIHNNLQVGLVATFLFLNVFSVLVAQNTEWSLRKLLFLFSIFPLYFVASQIISNRTQAIKIIQALVLSGFLVAVIGILQFLSQFVWSVEAIYGIWANFVIAPFLGDSFSEAVLKNPSWLVNIGGKTYLRATSLFPDPHMFSFYLGLLLPLSLGLWLEASKRKNWLFFSFVGIFIADLLTFSRGGYVGIAAGLLFVAIFFWNNLLKKYKLATGLIITFGIAILLIPSPVFQRFLSSFNLQEGSNQGRLEMWEKAIDVIQDNPVMGVGIGNYPLEVLPTATYRDPIYAHNTYLDIAVETGIVNMLVWVGILILTGLDFWRKARQEKIFFFMLISLVIFSTHSLVETALYSPVVLSLFLIILSLYNIDLKNEKNI